MSQGAAAVLQLVCSRGPLTGVQAAARRPAARRGTHWGPRAAPTHQRRCCTAAAAAAAAAVRELRPAVEDARGSGPAAEQAVRRAAQCLAEHDSLQVHRAALSCLAAFDSCDAHTEQIAALPAGSDLGLHAVANSLRLHRGDPEAAELALRLCANLCLLTLQDSSDSSHQAQLGALGATTHAAQALYTHGKSETGLCRRALQALLHLTMFNERNTKELVAADGVAIVTAVLAKHSQDHEVQDIGLSLLLRLLNAPMEDPKVDYVYEKDPGTALDALCRAARAFPESITIHDKVWHGMTLLAHNHHSLPEITRRLDRSMVSLLCGLLQTVATAGGGQGEVSQLRDQLLSSFCSVVSTVAGSQGADPATLVAGHASAVAITALNAGAEPGLEYALVSVLLSLSAHEDPRLLGPSGVATLLRLISRSPPAALGQRKQLLRLVWNLLNFDEGRRSFAELGGAPQVERAAKAQDADDEVRKLAEDIGTKARRPMVAAGD